MLASIVLTKRVGSTIIECVLHTSSFCLGYSILPYCSAAFCTDYNAAKLLASFDQSILTVIHISHRSLVYERLDFDPDNHIAKHARGEQALTWLRNHTEVKSIMSLIKLADHTEQILWYRCYMLVIDIQEDI